MTPVPRCYVLLRTSIGHTAIHSTHTGTSSWYKHEPWVVAFLDSVFTLRPVRKIESLNLGNLATNKYHCLPASNPHLQTAYAQLKLVGVSPVHPLRSLKELGQKELPIEPEVVSRYSARFKPKRRSGLNKSNYLRKNLFHFVVRSSSLAVECHVFDA